MKQRMKNEEWSAEGRALRFGVRESESGIRDLGSVKIWGVSLMREELAIDYLCICIALDASRITHGGFAEQHRIERRGSTKA